MANRVIDKYRPNHINLKRSKCVFFTFKRDFINMGWLEPDPVPFSGLFVDSDCLDQSKLWVFSLNLSTVITQLKQCDVKDEDLKGFAESYWNTRFPFEYYVQNYKAIEERWLKAFEKYSNTINPNYYPEVLYFGEVPGQYLQLFSPDS
ncbi:hypothetical protein [Neobacillus notoginsengisoli]|nr:hypothetical protein [Neobacillus notoginsengisoli]